MIIYGNSLKDLLRKCKMKYVIIVLVVIIIFVGITGCSKIEFDPKTSIIKYTLENARE